MGLSVSASSAVVFLGIFVAVGVLYPGVSNGVERYTDANADAMDRALAQSNTEVTLVNATYDDTSDTLTVTANNTGTRTIDVNETNLLVDGGLESFTVSVNGSSTTGVWLPGETATYEVDLSNTPDRVQLVVDYGVSVAREVA